MGLHQCVQNANRAYKLESDQADMKALLDRIIKSDGELAMYVWAAKLAATGETD